MEKSNLIRRILRAPYGLTSKLLQHLPAFKFIKETRNNEISISFDVWFRQQILGINYGPYWPLAPSSTVTGWRNMYVGIDVAPGFMPGCYIQALGKIYIGDYTRIAANVGLISSNHLIEDLQQHDLNEIVIGKYCWLGMGAIILPGVTLGDFTIVGAGSVVTKSFSEGYCVIGGNPAREIRKLDPAQCIPHFNEYEYHGFIPKEKFSNFQKKNLFI